MLLWLQEGKEVIFAFPLSDVTSLLNVEEHAFILKSSGGEIIFMTRAEFS